VTSAVIYARISKDREGRQVGIDRQEADCRRLAEQRGLTVVRVFVDNDTGASERSTKKRPAFEEMMKLAEAGQVGVILAYSNSRLTRRPLEFERLVAAHNKTGVTFRTVVSGDDDLSTADGLMVARIKASVDAAESHRISERTQRAKKQAKEEGRWQGGWRPYGFTADGVTPDPAEAAVVEQVSRDILDGRSVAAAVRDLNDRGITTSTGKPWTTRTLLRVLNRPNPLVDPTVGEGVRLLLADPSRRTTPGPERRWLLSGIARCGVCQDALRGSGSSMGHGRGTYPAYRCKTGKHVVISAVTLDQYVTAAVVARLSRPDVADLLAAPAVDTTDLRHEATTLRAQLDALADNLDIDLRTLARRSRALQERLDQVQAQLAAAVGMSPLAGLAGDPVPVWLRLDLDRKRAVVDTLATVTVNRGARGVVAAEHRWRADLPAFDPRRVVIEWKV
jgi:site-specific DNA recombinase